MNYSTSFLDLCSCALGGLLLLMFLLVPQSKPKAAAGCVKPSLMVECCYPVYDANFGTSNFSLPFSVDEIGSVTIVMSNGQKLEFNKGNGLLWSTTAKSPAPIEKQMSNGEIVTLSFAYKESKSKNSMASQVSVYADIELPDDDFSGSLQAIMIVEFPNKHDMFTNTKRDAPPEITNGQKYYVTNNELKTGSNNNVLSGTIGSKVTFFSSYPVLPSEDNNTFKNEYSGQTVNASFIIQDIQPKGEFQTTIYNEWIKKTDPQQKTQKFRDYSFCGITLGLSQGDEVSIQNNFIVPFN